MTALQKIALGTAPAGKDGDTFRTASTRMNANVDVLNAQAALTTIWTSITVATALTTANVGKRTTISLTTPGTINLPPARSCATDQVLFLRSAGSAVVTLAPASGSGDTVQLIRLNPGESVMFDTDGSSVWRCLWRGKSSSNEVVNGALTVGGSISVAYDLHAGGKVSGITGANLLLNGSAELGNTGWTTNYFSAAASTGDATGTHFTNIAPVSAHVYDYSSPVPVSAGTSVCIQGVVAASALTLGYAVIGVEFHSASTGLSSASMLSATAASVAAGVGLSLITATAVAPAGTIAMRFRIGVTASGDTQGPAAAVTFANLKYEAGTVPTLYSQEASIAWLQGAPAFSGRPTFAGKVPWDSGNFTPGNYAALNSSPAFTGAVAAPCMKVSGSGTGLSAQGNYLSWNDNAGSGQGYLTCNPGTGSGGFVFRTLNPAGTAEQGRLVISPGGGIIVSGSTPAQSFGPYGYLASSETGMVASQVSATASVYAPVNRIVAAEFDAVSDGRLKTNITALETSQAIRFIRDVSPVRFNWKDKPGAPRHFGYIAQGVGKAGFDSILKLAPDEEMEETTDADGWVSPSGARFSLDYNQIIPIHSAVLRDLLERIEVLEARVK